MQLPQPGISGSRGETFAGGSAAAGKLVSLIRRNPAILLGRALLFFLEQDRRRYLINVPVVLISESFELLPAFLTGVLITLLMHYSADKLLQLVVVILLFASSRGFIAWVRLRSKRILGQIALNCRYRARVWGFERLIGFSMNWHHQEAAGNKVQRLITGSDAIKEWANFHNELAGPLAAFIGVTCAAMFISPWFIFFSLYFIGGMFAIEIAYDRRIARLSTHINASVEAASGALVEGATNIMTVKAAGAGQMLHMAVNAKEASSATLGHQRVALNTQKWLAFQVHTCFALGIYLATVAYASLHGVIAIGFVATYVQYFNWLRSSTTSFTDRFQVMVERYAELMRVMPLFLDGGPGQGESRKAVFPAQWQQIVAEDVHYSWADKPALRGVSLALARGERVGITGPSGSGKSTFIKLLLGLYTPSAGRISIGSADLHSIAPDELSHHISVVLQDTELFNVSLRENITLMREFDADLYARVCAAACLDALIERLPQGDAAALGDRGHALSGGERQRIGVARALYRQPSILILDEATSALDDTTEDAVMAGILANLSGDALLIAIAHRTRSLRAMTRHVVFGEGVLTVASEPGGEIVADSQHG